MDKELLFQFMRVKFREAGFTEAEIELHMQSFTERYQNKTDDEMEADIKRRGGASRIAAATVERRNTVLMADPDYSAFVASGQPATANAAADADGASADQKQAEVTETPAKQESTNEDDPLAAWFSAPSEKKSEDDVVSSLFSDEVKTERAAANEKPAAAPASGQGQTVHNIPLFGENGGAQGQSVPRPPRAPMPPKASTEADLGRTRVIAVPAAEQPSKTTASAQTRVASDTYKEEQQAIWGGSSDIRDGSGGNARTTVVSAAGQQTRSARSQAEKQPAKTEKAKIEYADRGNVTWLQEKTYWGEGSEEGVKRFRIILAVSALPIIALLLVYAVIALGLIVLMPVLMAAFVIGLVAEVAVGSLVALVAVIYGVSQLFIVMPIGMFELGLGVAAIGVTMFVGILMYNVAVRLLPFLLRQFIRFQSVFKGFLQDLYYYVKGECYRK